MVNPPGSERDQEDDMNQLVSIRPVAVIGAGATGRASASPACSVISAIPALSAFAASGGRGPIGKPEVAA